MLQWMGGSRKKVATTRKSIQQRQKQYFEQRRRQQQMSGLVERYKEGAGGSQLGLNSRSLDVVSFANLATVSHQNKPDIFSPLNGNGNSARVRSEVDYHISEEHAVVAGNVNTADPVVLEDGMPSCHQAETASSYKVYHSPKCNGNSNSGITNKPQLSKVLSEQQYSLIDLLDYDEPKKHLKEKDTHESHVAFSVQGVGKIEAETPPLSPQQPDRYVSYGGSIPLKFGRQSSSSQLHSSELNEYGIEIDAMMQDFQIPLRNSMEFSNAEKEPCDKWKHNSPVMKDLRKFGCRHGEIGTPFSNRTFGAPRTEELFDGSELFDTNGIYGGKLNKFWKDEPFKTDNNSDFVMPIDEMSDYSFGGSHLQKKRFASETTERFDISEIPASKQRISEDDYDFIVEDKSRHYSLGTDFDFSNKTCKPEWSCHMTEDVRESLNSLSEESTSSVRDDTNRSLLSKSKSRHRRRRQNTFGSTTNKYSAKNIFGEGWHDDNGDRTEDVNNACILGKPGHMATQSKAAFNLDCGFLHREEPHGSQFEEGCSSPCMTSGVKSAFLTDEMQLPHAPSKCWTDDAFAAWDHEGCADSRVQLARSKYTDGSPKKSASANFSSENLSFLQPSSHSFSGVEFRSLAEDFSAHSHNCELQGRPPDSSGGAACPRGNSMPDFMTQRNKDKDDADYSKYFQKKVNVQREVTASKSWEPIGSSHCGENSSECEEAKNGTSDTTSTVNIPDRCESTVDEKESQHDAEVNLPSQNEHEEIDREKRGGRQATAVMKRPSFFVGSSSQVMILQRYAFQLLCVQK